MFDSVFKKVASATVVLSAAALGLTACGGEQASANCPAQYTIGFSHPVGESTFVKALKTQIEQQAEQQGCTEVLMDNTQGNDLEAQRSTVETWVTQKLDAIVVFPVDAAAMAPLQKRAQANGTKWIAYASQIDGADGYTGFDNVTSGKIVGDEAAAFIQENGLAGKVTAAVTSLTDFPDIAGRWEEPVEAIEAAGVEVVSLQDCADQACGLEITEALLRQHPNLRVFIGITDDPALGAQKAFKNAGVDPAEVFIGGQDGSLQALEAVKAGGDYRVTATIDMEDLARSIVEDSTNAVTGEGETESEARVIPASLQDPGTLNSLIEQLQVK